MPRQNMRSHLLNLVISALVAGFVSGYSTAALAHDEHNEHDGGGGHHFVPKNEGPKLSPAERFAGSAPVDLNNGFGFNNGTYGVENPEITKYAAGSTWAVSLSDLGYPFENKDRFVSTLDERIRFYEEALVNWARVSDITKPEVKEYAAKATADLTPRLERARGAWSTAKSAGRGNWEKASEEAKHAFLDLQSFYYSLHKNVGR